MGEKRAYVILSTLKIKINVHYGCYMEVWHRAVTWILLYIWGSFECVLFYLSINFEKD